MQTVTKYWTSRRRKLHSILCSFNINLNSALSTVTETCCCSSFRHRPVQMLLHQTSCIRACLGALLQPLTIMVSQNLTAFHGLALTVVFPMRWENSRASRFFWCWCNQTFRCFTVVEKSILALTVIVPIKCLGRKSGARNRECPTGRAAQTPHSPGSRLRSACGGALKTRNVSNVISPRAEMPRAER